MSSTRSGATLRRAGRRAGRRNGLLAGLTAVLMSAVVACGGGAPAEQSGEPAAAGAPGADASAFPLTLTSPYGETTLQAPPARVGAMGIAECDTTLALGVTPVAAGGYGDLDGWFTDAAPGVENLEISDGIPYERIASFSPDLIITGWGDDADYAQLSEIAPVLWQVSDTFSTEWRDQVTTIAEALGRTAEGAEQIATVEQRIEETAAANPGFVGRTFTWSTYDPGLVNLLDLPTAPVAQFLDELGLQMKPEIADPNSIYSREVSTEELDVLDADVVFVYPSSPEAQADLEALRTFQSLTATQNGGVVFLDDALANAFNSPTLLSIPYLLDNLTPELATATGA